MQNNAQVTYLLDTNLILRHLLDDHPEQSPKAHAFLQKISKGEEKARIDPLILAECLYVLEKTYKVHRAEISNSLVNIINIAGIINRDKGEIIGALIKYKNSRADFVDCWLAASSSAEKIVVSFDKDMKKLQAFYKTL